MIQSVTSTDILPDLAVAEQVLGTEFDVWTFNQQWHRVYRNSQTSDHRSVREYVQLIELMSRAVRDNAASVERIDRNRSIALYPLGENVQRTVAVRMLDDRSDDILQFVNRVVNAAHSEQIRNRFVRQKLAESDLKLAAWTTRIAQGNAELQWLHKLSISTQVSDQTDSPLAVAKRILPEMCRLIRARSVVFIQAPPANAAGHEELPAWQTGEARVPESVCLSIIQETAARSAGPPLVRNYAVPKHAVTGFPGILTCIVKAVTRDNERVGWILALNKDLQYLVRDEMLDRPVSTIQKECSFGYFESGLVEAAANAISSHARNNSLLNEKQSLFEGAIRSLVNAIDAKDSYTCGHSDRVAAYAREISEVLGMDGTFCEQIYLTGLLHDVGKIGVPDHVLQKPDRLTDAEFAEIKKHPVIGHEILQHFGGFDGVLPGVLHHHEAVNGSGYPFGLSGEEIPLCARVLAVADAFDAMTSDRPYRAGMTIEQASQVISDGAGEQWDTECVRAFESCLRNNRFDQYHDLLAPATQPPQCSERARYGRTF